MKEYGKIEKMELCKKYNQNVNKNINKFEGFTKEDMLELSMWQVEILDRNSKHKCVRDSWDKWNKMAKVLIREILQESIEVKTNKGIKNIFKVDGNVAVLCKKCGGTGSNCQRKNNKCDCIRGWYYDNSIIEITESEYKKRACKKYFALNNKNRIISKYTENELMEIEFDEFLSITGIRNL